MLDFPSKSVIIIPVDDSNLRSTGCSAVLVARLNGVQEAVSSTLATRTKQLGVEISNEASDSQGSGAFFVLVSFSEATTPSSAGESKKDWFYNKCWGREKSRP